MPWNVYRCPNGGGRKGRACGPSAIVWARLACAAYGLVPLSLMLMPQAPIDCANNFYALLQWITYRLSGSRASASYEQAEALANVLLFIPAAVLLRLAAPSAAAMALLGLLLGASFAAETVQYLTLSGRSPSLFDTSMNSLGAAIGMSAGTPLLRRVRGAPEVGHDVAGAESRGRNRN